MANCVALCGSRSRVATGSEDTLGRRTRWRGDDRQGVDALTRNLSFAETNWPALKGQWDVVSGDVFKDKCPSDKKSIFIPLNPPYGLRLEHDTQDMYKRIGSWLKKGFDADQRRFGFILLADSKAFHAFEKEIGAENLKGIQSFTQGGQHIRCVLFDINPSAQT